MEEQITVLETLALAHLTLLVSHLSLIFANITFSFPDTILCHIFIDAK